MLKIKDLIFYFGMFINIIAFGFFMHYIDYNGYYTLFLLLFNILYYGIWIILDLYNSHIHKWLNKNI
jgi:hypothetical protein